MDPNFTLRTGKWAGKTISWLEKNQAGYLAWVKLERPEMLKGSVVKEVKAKPISEVKPMLDTAPVTSMVPNMNFWNEGPDLMSLPYLKKMKEDLDNKK